MKPYRRRPGVMKALKVLKIWSDAEGQDYVDEFNHNTNWTKRMVNTRCPCSCSCCGNMRNDKWESHKDRISRQERRSELSFKEQIADVFTQCDEE